MIENVSLCHHPVARRCAINFIMKRFLTVFLTVFFDSFLRHMIENVSLCHHPVARRCAINFIMKRVTCNGDGHILTGVHCADYITSVRRNT